MTRGEDVIVTNNFEETKRLGEEFARSHPFGSEPQGRRLAGRNLVIALYGELGSGKTTFVQGLAKGLGIKRRIISPTFIIIRSYKIGANVVIPNSFRDLREKKMLKQVQHDNSRQSLTIKFFYHIDLYRIKNEKDIEVLGLDEIIRDPQNIIAIEWVEKMGKLLPKKRWDVKFEYLGEDKRKITIVSS